MESILDMQTLRNSINESILSVCLTDFKFKHSLSIVGVLTIQTDNFEPIEINVKQNVYIQPTNDSNTEIVMVNQVDAPSEDTQKSLETIKIEMASDLSQDGLHVCKSTIDPHSITDPAINVELPEHIDEHDSPVESNLMVISDNYMRDNSFKQPRFHRARTTPISACHRCITCQGVFTKANYLQIHNRVHTGEKPFKCGTCGRSFTFSNALTRHMMMHTGEKPYLCSTCNRRFARVDHFKAHKCKREDPSMKVIRSRSNISYANFDKRVKEDEYPVLYPNVLPGGE